MWDGDGVEDVGRGSRQSPALQCEFLTGGGRAAKLIAARDWASTSLGPLEAWPQSLKIACGILLRSPVPMVMLWGRDGVMLYNDAYSVFAGGRHPEILGSRVREGWPEVADFNDNILKVGLAGGTLAYRDQELTLYRHGVPEQVWMDLDYSPVLDESGNPAGVLCILSETSERVAAEAALRAERDRARGVLENMAEGFVLLDREFQVLDINAEGMRLEKRPRDAIIGKTHWVAWPGTEDSELGRLYKRAMAERVPVSREHRYDWPDGHHAWMDMRAYPVEQGLALFYRDVTDRKDAEEAAGRSAAAAAVQAAERETMLSQLTEGVIIADAQGQITFVNEAAERLHGAKLLGVAPEDYTAKYRLLTEDGEPYPALELPLARAILNGETVVDARWRIRRPDGTEVLAIGSAQPIVDGEPIGAVLTLRDDTERMRSEHELRETSRRLDAILNNTRMAVFLMDEHQHCAFANAAAEALTGYSFAELHGRPLHDAIHNKKPDGSHYPSEDCPIDRAFPERAQMSGEELFVAPDGSFYPVAFTASPVLDDSGRPIGTVIEARNIAEERAQNSALLASEEFNRRVLESSADCIKVLDLDGRVEFMSEGGMCVMEVDDFGAIRGECWPDFWRGDEHPKALAALEAARSGGTGRFQGFATTMKGTPRWWDVIVSPIAGADGRPERLLSISRDVTATKQAEERLRELNETLEMQVEKRTEERDRAWRLSQDLLVIAEQDGTIAQVNAAWAELLGWEPDDLIGQSFVSFTHPDDLQATLAAFAGIFEAPLSAPYEYRFRHRDGTYRWFAWTGSFEQGRVYANGRHATAEHEQAEALAKLEDALRQSQKMEAVGQLTGGIAHDFNNMLAVVIGSLDLLGRRLGNADARAKRYVDAATEGARRAALLTQRLLAFSRQQPLQPEAIDANKLVTGMSDLLRGSLGSDIRFETVLAGGGWRAHADLNQLENLLLNLAVNARDAMPEGGRLTIETQNAHLDERYAAAHLGVPAGQYVLIAVSDTGSGMPGEVIAKAFDPFFTTKEVGKGTGLGLSQVYGFVKQSGGHVKIYSELGQGTTIKVYLPRLLGSDHDGMQDESLTELPLGEFQEVILVVEDEPAVRQFSIDALSELGYRVLEADGAATALRMLDAHPEITLLFTDIVMPDVNGRKLADEARRRRPDLKVLFTTGYTRNAVVHNGVLDPGVELIGKPFTVEELAAKVREVIDTPAPDGLAMPSP